MSGKPKPEVKDDNAKVKAVAAELLKHAVVAGYNYITAAAPAPAAATDAPAAPATEASSSPLGSIGAALLEAAAPQLETAGKKVLEGIAAPVVDAISSGFNKVVDHLAHPAGWWTVARASDVYNRIAGTTNAPTLTPPSEEKIAAAAPAPAPATEVAPAPAAASSSTVTLTPSTDVVESTNPFDIFDFPAPEAAAPVEAAAVVEAHGVADLAGELPNVVLD